MTKDRESYAVHDEKGQLVALIHIDGYVPQSSMTPAPVGWSGALRQFRIVEGRKDLLRLWHNWMPLVIRSSSGQEALARIAGFPSEQNGLGFLQFV